MTKVDIVTEIPKPTGIDKSSVLSVVEQFMTDVKDNIAHGENVYLRGFGSFIVKRRADKTARNINRNYFQKQHEKLSDIISCHNL